MVPSCHEPCSKRNVGVIYVKELWPPGWVWVTIGLVQCLEELSSDVHQDPCDEALGQAWNQSELRSGVDSQWREGY